MVSCLTIGRLLAVFLSIVLKPHHIMYMTTVVIYAGIAILYFFANTSETMLWIGVASIGLGMSAVIGALYVFAEERIRVTGIVMSVFTVTGTIVSSGFPALIGHYIDQDPEILIYVAGIGLTAFTAILVVAHLCLPRPLEGKYEWNYQESRIRKMLTR
jgi:MFS family permease